MSDVVRLAAAAELLDVSPSTALRLAQRGELPGAIKVGKQWRVSVPKLEKHLHGEESV